MKIHGFEVWAYEGCPAQLVNAPTLGKAKAIVFGNLLDVRPDARFVDVRGRKVSDDPVMTPALERVMEYRGRPDLGPGVEVTIARGRRGRIVDGCGGACFAVLMETGESLSVHPIDIVEIGDPGKDEDDNEDALDKALREAVDLAEDPEVRARHYEAVRRGLGLDGGEVESCD